MKVRLLLLVRTYLLFLCVFLMQKPFFMLHYQVFYSEIPPIDWGRVMWNGFPLDLSLSGYLTVVPALLLMLSIWTKSKVIYRIWHGYLAVIALLLSVILIVDMGLYEHWGFRLDATPLFYLFSSPKDALASLTIGMAIAGLLAIVGYATLLYGVFRISLMRKKSWRRLEKPVHEIPVTAGMLFCTALLFIPIRGGFTVSTMNTGKVYFSTNQRLNHAAINPAFSLMESLSKQKDFAVQYRFMEDAEAECIFAQLCDTTTVCTDTLLTAKRPDILLIILESFSSRLMTELGGERDIAPCLDSLSREGVLFTNIYANSFRTDRGLVSILSGYPAQPTTSLMKYPRKTQSIPGIAGRLKQAGYETHYYYGGDADFTNMRSYLMSSGFDTIVCDRDFPVSERLSKWGVHDHLVFQRLLDDIRAEKGLINEKPAFRVMQTSSSHEPFEVPYRRLENDRLNAFAYTDSCIGHFINEYKKLPQWENTWIIMLPDHVGAYPEQLDNFTQERYRIPLLMLGGAIVAPRRVDVIGSQQDLAATVLSQLGLPHNDFIFSKDLLNSNAPHFAFFTVPDAFGFVTGDNCLIFDNQSSATVVDEGNNPGANLELGKAYLQMLYNDIAKR